MPSKYTWAEDIYDTWAQLCVALTNFHIELHPLRSDDGTWYIKYVNRLKNRSEQEGETHSLTN